MCNFETDKIDILSQTLVMRTHNILQQEPYAIIADSRIRISCIELHFGPK